LRNKSIGHDSEPAYDSPGCIWIPPASTTTPTATSVVVVSIVIIVWTAVVTAAIVTICLIAVPIGPVVVSVRPIVVVSAIISAITISTIAVLVVLVLVLDLVLVLVLVLVLTLAGVGNRTDQSTDQSMATGTSETTEIVVGCHSFKRWWWRRERLVKVIPSAVKAWVVVMIVGGRSVIVRTSFLHGWMDGCEMRGRDGRIPSRCFVVMRSGKEVEAECCLKVWD
jgi:hypothetical protein